MKRILVSSEMKQNLYLSVNLLAILSIPTNVFGAEEPSHIIRSTGKHIHKSGQIFYKSEFKVEAGDNDSEEEDTSTGTIHNHDELILLRNGKFSGDGKIVNYRDIENDIPRTNRIEDTYVTTASTKLTTDGGLAEAAYYDFARRDQEVEGTTKITEFYTTNNSVVRKSNAETVEEYRAGEPGNIITTKEEVGVNLEIRGNFIQRDTREDRSYYLGNLTANSIEPHSSEVHDSIDGSLHSIRGYTKLSRAEAIEGLRQNAESSGIQLNIDGEKINSITSGEDNSVIITTPSRRITKTNAEDISLTETISGRNYSTTVDTNGIVTTNNPNQVTALPSTTPGTAFSFERKISGDSYTYTPVYLPEVNENLVLEKTVPEGAALTQYETELNEELRESRENGNFKYSDWLGADPVTEYKGANSWYNGVLKLKRGAIIIPSTAELVGGRVEIGEVPGEYANAKAFHDALSSPDTYETAAAAATTTHPTEFEFQGGPKDEYNRPAIYMNGNSSLYFNVTEGSDGNRIFSFYGSLHGTESDRIIVEKGEVRWKGDGEGFKGVLAVAEGTKFEVRSSDAGSSSVYNGKFPNANLYQIYAERTVDDDGTVHEAGDLIITTKTPTVIDTSGIENVTINNGYMHLTNTGSEDEGKLTFKNSTLDRGSFVEIAGKSEIENVTVKGVAVASGDMTAKNLKLQGGVLAVEGSVKTDNAEVGSTVVLWGNDNIDRNFEIGRNLTITDNHTLKLYIDVDPANRQTDSLITNNTTIIHSGNGVEIGGINLINPPSQDMTFNVLTGSAANQIPVMIGATYNGVTTFSVYQGGHFQTVNNADFNSEGRVSDTDIPYRYNVTSGNNLTTTQLNDGTGGWSVIDLNGATWYVYGSDQAGNGNYMISASRLGRTADNISADNFAIPVEAMHLTALSGVSQMFTLVSDDFGYLDKYQTGKFGFWNKTFGGKDKFETSSSDIKSTDYGTVFGFDTKPVVVGKSQTEFMGTIFGGVTHRNTKFTYQTQNHKASQKGYIAGLKGAFFNGKYSLELIGSYQFIKSTSKKAKYSANVKSHLYSVGAKAGYNFNITDKVSVRPSLLLDYTFAKTPNYSVISTGKAITKNIHRIDVVPELTLSRKLGQWNAFVFANYHQRFGSKGSYTFRGVEYKDLTKKHHVEFGLGVNRVDLSNRTNFGFKISKKVCGVKGIKASINLGVKF